MKKSLVVLSALFLLSTTGFSFAQDANGHDPAMSPKAREVRQHNRIKQGVKSGKISKAQHAKLARQGRAINQERKADKRADGGKLDKSDRQNIEKQQNERSKEIYDDKH